MISLYMEPFSEAEIAYRRERLIAQFTRSRRPMSLKWPVGLLSPNRRHPRRLPTPKPAPHHATSIS